jgi:uncharacterized protein
MHFVISPAKALNFERQPVASSLGTWPLYTNQAQALVNVLRRQSVQELRGLMKLSEKLASLNVSRYKAWVAQPNEHTPVQAAMLAFNGDVYAGLDAQTLGKSDLLWAQSHVSILSGLYGVLRPLDQIQAYRLEMGSALKNNRGNNLYAFWGETLIQYFNQMLKLPSSVVLVNLASQEYFKVLKNSALQATIIDCVFEDWKNDRYKIISFFAKRARGLMVRYAILNRLKTPQQLQQFEGEGYYFASSVSTPNRLVFRRQS